MSNEKVVADPNIMVQPNDDGSFMILVKLEMLKRSNTQLIAILEKLEKYNLNEDWIRILDQNYLRQFRFSYSVETGELTYLKKKIMHRLLTMEENSGEILTLEEKKTFLCSRFNMIFPDDDVLGMIPEEQPLIVHKVDLGLRHAWFYHQYNIADLVDFHGFTKVVTEKLSENDAAMMNLESIISGNWCLTQYTWQAEVMQTAIQFLQIFATSGYTEWVHPSDQDPTGVHSSKDPPSDTTVQLFTLQAKASAVKAIMTVSSTELDKLEEQITSLKKKIDDAQDMVDDEQPPMLVPPDQPPSEDMDTALATEEEIRSELKSQDPQPE